MDYEIDLCPTHHCIRLTVSAETVTNELAEEIYKHLVELTSEGGPYAAIFDLSATKYTTMPTDSVRSWGRHRPPAIPMGFCPFCGATRKQVVVGTEPVIFGLARMFEMCGEGGGNDAFEVARSLQEAYDIVGASPEEFTQCIIWPHEPTSPPTLEQQPSPQAQSPSRPRRAGHPRSRSDRSHLPPRQPRRGR